MSHKSAMEGSRVAHETLFILFFYLGQKWNK